MKVLLASSEDAASINIRDRLLEETDWRAIEPFDENPAYIKEGMVLLEKNGTHLYMEGIDREITSYLTDLPDQGPRQQSDNPLDLLVFLSRHRSEKDILSLTVHPPGNFLKAEYGGEDGSLPPSAPIEMTAALKALYKKKKELGIPDRTTYEVTHHGPLVNSPCFFIEIGSNEERWGIEVLGRAIARALLSDEFSRPSSDIPIAIGIGGGHYAPRFTDRAMRNKYAFGHMIPDYILDESDDIARLLGMAKKSTPGATHVFVHRSGRNKDLLQGIGPICEDLDLIIANNELQ